MTLLHSHTDQHHQEALVDVNLILESLNNSLLAYGQWVNIVGYVTQQEHEPSLEGFPEAYVTSVQAIMYWATGALPICWHEDAMNEMRAVHG